MKTFEEKFTAWVDGELKGRELAEFEAELPHALDAKLEKLASRQVGNLLREHGRAPELKNEDFFNHQLMQQIESGQAKQETKPARRKFAWSLPRLALAGAFSLCVALGLYHTMIPKQAEQTTAASGKFEVINGHDVQVYDSPQNGVDVHVVYLTGSGMKPDADKHASPEKRKDK